jgi:hypothetical protein
MLSCVVLYRISKKNAETSAFSVLFFLVSFVRVSSTLNRDTKSWGKQFLTDGSEETCWNSDQGSPQWIVIECAEPIRPKTLHITFQGGFTGQDCELQYAKEENWETLMTFYPQDKNHPQSFSIPKQELHSKWRILFGRSSDFYGRVIVYWLDFSQ